MASWKANIKKTAHACIEKSTIAKHLAAGTKSASLHICQGKNKRAL